MIILIGKNLSVLVYQIAKPLILFDSLIQWLMHFNESLSMKLEDVMRWKEN